MPDDLRLPFASDYAKDGQPEPAEPDYVGGFAGQVPCRVSWGPPQIAFDTRSGNSVVIPARIRAKDLRKAVPYLLGWASRGAVGGFNGQGLKRVLPIRDPLGLGMYCTGIVNGTLANYSGFRVMELPPDDVAPDGNIYDSTNAQDFGPYDIDFLDPKSKLSSLFRYAILNCRFDHLHFSVASDDVADGSPRGERERFCVSNYINGVEYVALKDGSVVWSTDEAPISVGGVVGQGASPPKPNSPAGGSGGYVRAVGELKTQWLGVPRDVVALLFAKWQKKQGRVNRDEFVVYLADDIISFPPETLLLQAPRTDERVNALGFLCYDITYSMSYRPETFNRFLNVKDGTYYRVVWGDPQNQQPIFPLTDFDSLFSA